MDHGFLISVFVFLSASILIVPIIKLSGLGSVIGYLFAGILIGPSVLGLITEPETILHFSEFGVVMMLFIIGLELQPKELWQMRSRLIGLGGLQVGITTVLVSVSLFLLGLSPAESLVFGMAMALSSTAVALQTMQDRQLMLTTTGQSGFAVLLFQDVVVIAMIASIPLIAVNFGVADGVVSQVSADSHSGSSNGLEGWQLAIAIIVCFGGMILFGRKLLQPLFKLIARSKVRETFTAIALALVIGSALLMQWLGLSPAMGAFFAGVVLADSDYRHQLERDIEPFKALLLGLFFISVGMSLEFGVIAANPLIVLGFTIALVILKAIVLLIVGRIYSLESSSNRLFACLLCQAGEFGFVIFQFARAEGILSSDIVSQGNAIIALSMAFTPVLLLIYDQFTKDSTQEKTTGEAPENLTPKALILGFGRVGQVAARLLHTQDIQTTVLDYDGDHIEFIRQYGYRVFYGDIADMELLKKAGAETADLIIVCIDDPETATQVAKDAKEQFPNAKILARAKGRPHMFDLMALDIDFVERETVRGAIALGGKGLELLGFDKAYVQDLEKRFLIHDFELIKDTWKHRHDTDLLINKAKTSTELMKQTIMAEMKEDHGEHNS